MQGCLHRFSDTLTDCLCAGSLVGLWPRFIETAWLDVKPLEIRLAHLPQAFDGFRLVHLSDLHLSSRTPLRLLKKVQQALERLRPDCIAFTGDFICYAKLDQLEPLQRVLRGWKSVAPVIACLGNHDYERYVTQRDGLAKVQAEPKPFLVRALKRLIFERSHPKAHDYSDQQLAPHRELVELLSSEGIELLQEKGYAISRGDQKLLFWGLDDLWAAGGKAVSIPKASLEGVVGPVVLAHNPDHIDLMDQLPPSLVLSGHTHGGNINLPWIRSRLRTVHHADRLQGYSQVGAHQLYVSRGLCDPFPFRFFSRPELTCMSLRRVVP